LSISEYIVQNDEGVLDEPASYESAGVYSVTPVEDDPNYEFDDIGNEAGILYVNPFGPSTRAIKPVLNCVEEQPGGIFIANFAYKNDNDDAVYIPVGPPDNVLDGGPYEEGVSGIQLIEWRIFEEPEWVWVEAEHQPTVFQSGGGEFRVHFFGDELTLTINSLGEDHNVSNAASANSNSTKCNPNTKSASVATELEEEDILELEDLMVYPNPVTGKVNLVMKDIEHYKMLMLLDMTGRAHPITSIKTRSDRLEIDLSGLGAGTYFFKLMMEDATRVIQLIKL